MKRYQGPDYERKVHLYMDQEGAKIPHSNQPFANTLCKMNSNVPESHITTDPEKVTCKICRKDARFKSLLNSRFGKFRNVNEDYGKTAYPQMYPRLGFVNGMRTRHRRNWRGKLILQVEETVPYNYDPRTDIEPGGYTGRWRDATLADMGGGVV